VLARGKAARAHLAREARILGRHLDALAAAVELPAVIEATQRIAFDPAEVQRRAAMRTAVFENLSASRFATIERVVLAHDADWLCVPLRQVLAAMHGKPELPHEAPAGRARARGRDVDQLFSLHGETLEQSATVVKIPTGGAIACGTAIAAYGHHRPMEA